MWKTFTQNESDPAVYLKVDVFDDNTIKSESPEDLVRYRISVTNFIRMWCKVYDNRGILKMMLDSNKGIETENKKEFIQAGLFILTSPKLVDKKEFIETQCGDLSVSLLRKSPIVLRMNFLLSHCSAEHFFESITRSLLEVIDDQQSRESKFKALLKRKDKEIEDILDSDSMIRDPRKKQKDKEHIETQSAIDQLFGTDPEEMVCAKHIILHGRPLPILPPDKVIVKQELLDPGPSNGNSTGTLINQATNKHKVLSQFSTLQFQIPAIKSENNSDTKQHYRCEVNNVTMNDLYETKYAMNGLNHSTNMLGKCSTTVNGSNNDQKPLIDVNETSQTTQYGGQLTDLGLNSEQNSNTGLTRRHSQSPDRKPDVPRTHCTPKKRRNNLNY